MRDESARYFAFRNDRILAARSSILRQHIYQHSFVMPITVGLCVLVEIYTFETQDLWVWYKKLRSTVVSAVQGIRWGTELLGQFLPGEGG